MPHYLLSVCYPAGAEPPSPERLETIMADVATLNEQMRSAGVWVFGGGLQEPSTATVVTRRGGDSVLTDGPFAETQEQVGGVTVIEVPDLDAALLWAGRMATAVPSPIEIRPFAAWAS
jgi:hypothetical protein